MRYPAGRRILCVAVVAAGAAFEPICALAATTMDDSNKWAWGSTGWINCRPDSTNGAAIGEFYCSGYFWSSGTGWINLGNGNPTNGIQYTNVSSNDYGVNHDGKGNLRGYAWSPNIGWVNFEATGAPKVDLGTGILSGYAWGGSVGWISFTNVQAFSQTEFFTNGVDSDLDGLPDAWERTESGSLSVLFGGSSNYDHDAYTDAEEYMCGTDPQAGDSFLELTSVGWAGGSNTITWTCDPARAYRVETNRWLTNANGWVVSILSNITTTSESNVTKTIPFGSNFCGFCRIKVALPLSWP